MIWSYVAKRPPVALRAPSHAPIPPSLSCISLLPAQGRKPDKEAARQLSNRLVQLALTASLDEGKDTPFAKAVSIRSHLARQRSPPSHLASQSRECDRLRHVHSSHVMLVSHYPPLRQPKTQNIDTEH